MKKNPRDFNIASKFFLLVAIYLSLRKIMELVPQIYIADMLDCSSEHYILEMIFCLLIIIAIIFTLMRKRFGLIALLVLAVLKMFATIPVGDDVSYAYHLGRQFGEFIINYGLFIIAMCFKVNGLSGWVSMLASEEYVAKKIVIEDDSHSQC